MLNSRQIVRVAQTAFSGIITTRNAFLVFLFCSMRLHFKESREKINGSDASAIRIFEAGF